eukprot:8611723-Pyramimonas_sp.AAC.1
MRTCYYLGHWNDSKILPPNSTAGTSYYSVVRVAGRDQRLCIVTTFPPTPSYSSGPERGSGSKKAAKLPY